MKRRIFTSRLIVTVITLIGIVLIIGGIFLVHRDALMRGAPSYLHDSKVNYTEAVSYWESQLRHNSGASAYAVFTSEGNALSAGESHTLAHAFGSALYRILGVEGLDICSAEFNYGCYHEFMGNAIVDKGLDSVSVLHDACFGIGIDYGKSGACLHGVGHGILGYLGYSLGNLEQALTICGSFNGGNKSSTCTDGVYMEYNLRLLTSTDSSATSGDKYNARALTKESRYQPCLSLDPEYRPGCIFELPVWWFRTIDSTDTEDRAVLYGNYCSVFSSESERFPCYRGTGYMLAGIADLNLKSAQAYCDLSSSGETDRMYCYTGIAQRLKSERVPDSDAVCDSFELNTPGVVFCRAFVGIDPRTRF